RDVISNAAAPSAGRRIIPRAVLRFRLGMPAERIAGEVADVGQCRKVIAHRIETDLQGQFLLEKELLNGYFVETQILPLPENMLIREIAVGPVGGQAAAGAVRHRKARDGVRPNSQLVEIKAEAE